MKLIGRILAILAAALVIAGILLAIGSFSASTDAVAGMASTGAAGHIGTEHMQNGFNLAGIVQILPNLTVVGIITAIVAPIKQRLASKRRPGTPARRPQNASPAA